MRNLLLERENGKRGPFLRGVRGQVLQSDKENYSSPK
jgi:hypothetical protein